MDKRRLGQSDLHVSRICLGTMTWGEQNTEAEAHEQLDYAIAHGVNFIDAAELYPVPPRKETYGATEHCIGTWLAKRGRRDDVIIASKVTGPVRGDDDFSYMRGGPRLTAAQIVAACDASLQRLQTDYIDLYQLHWPERSANYFGRLGVDAIHDPSDAVSLRESLEAMAQLQQAGKIRHVGLSNETPWGFMHSLRLADELGLARVVSVQNPYNLLNRSYEVGMAEISLREGIGLLAYSPLAFGTLTGKYRHGARPEQARLTRYERFQRYNNAQAEAAVERYAAVAEAAGITLTQLALAFVNQRTFVSSNIIGATSIEQLAENINSMQVALSSETQAAIDAVHAEISNPCP